MSSKWSYLVWFTMILAVVGILNLFGIPQFFLYVIVAVFGTLMFIGFVRRLRNERNSAILYEKKKEEQKIIREIKDQNGRLHSLSEPAIIRKNGDEEYYIDGVLFQDRFLWKNVTSRQLSFDNCLRLRNIEQRRIAMKYCLTAEKVLEEWKQIILLNKDDRGNTLYEYRHQELQEPIRILVYKDPSTDRTYYSFVPPNITKASQGMAWKFQITEKEYDSLRFEA